MATLKINFLKSVITLFTLCLIGTASAIPNSNGEEKGKEVIVPKKVVYHYFKFTGAPGQEADETLWVYTNNPSAESCNGDNGGCLIEVAETYTTLNSSSQRVLTQPVPVINSSGHLNPDTSDPMIQSASNKI